MVIFAGGVVGSPSPEESTTKSRCPSWFRSTKVASAGADGRGRSERQRPPPIQSGSFVHALPGVVPPAHLAVAGGGAGPSLLGRLISTADATPGSIVAITLVLLSLSK